MSSTYILKSLIQKVNYLERKVRDIETGRGSLYDSSISDADALEYIDCLLYFSQNLKKDLLHKQLYCDSEDKQLIANIYNEVCVLESDLLQLIINKEVFNPTSHSRCPRMIRSIECVQCNEANRYNYPPALLSKLGKMTTCNNHLTANLERLYFERLPCLPCNSRKIEKSPYTSEECIILSDSLTTSSQSDDIFDDGKYYVKKIPVKSIQMVKKPTRIRYSHRTVPISINKSKNQPSAQRKDPSKAKRNVLVENTNRQKQKVRRNKKNSKQKRKRKAYKFGLEKSPSNHISVKSSLAQGPVDKTQVFYVKKYPGSPWIENNQIVDLNDEVIYVPYAVKSTTTGIKESDHRQKQYREYELQFAINADQSLYHAGVKLSDDRQQKSKKSGLIVNGNNNSKASVESHFIKSKWFRTGQSRENGNQYIDIEPTHNSQILNIILPEISSSGKQPQLSDRLPEQESKFKNVTKNMDFTPSEKYANVNSFNKPMKQQNNKISTSFNDGQSTEIYRVIDSHSNGELVLTKLPPDSYKNLFGGDVNVQSIYVTGVPGSYPEHGNVHRSISDVLQPNVKPVRDKRLSSVSKLSVANVTQNDPNYQAPSDNISRISVGEKKRSKIWSTISKLSGKRMSQIDMKRNSASNLESENRKLSQTLSKASRKSLASKKTVNSPLIDNLSLANKQNVEAKNKSTPDILDKNVKASSSKLSLAKLLHLNKDKESNTGKDLHGNRSKLFWKKLKADSTNRTQFTGVTERNYTSIPAIVGEDLGSRLSVNSYPQNNIGVTENRRKQTDKRQTSVKIENNSATNGVNDALNYSLHYEREKRNKLDLCSIPSSLDNIIPSKCNKIMSHQEVILSEHKLNGNEYHNKVHKIFTYPSFSRSKKIIIQKHNPDALGTANVCKCCSCKRVNHRNINVQMTNNSSLTDSSYSMDWTSIVHKMKENN